MDPLKASSAEPREATASMAEPDAPLRGLIGYQLLRANHRAMARFKTVFSALGLRRTTYSCLCIIVENPGLRQTQLAQALAIERPNLVQFVDELETRGLVERRVADGDRRAYALQPTKKGCALAKKATETAHMLDKELTRGLSPEQSQLLRDALRVVEENARHAKEDDEH